MLERLLRATDVRRPERGFEPLVPRENRPTAERPAELARRSARGGRRRRERRQASGRAAQGVGGPDHDRAAVAHRALEAFDDALDEQRLEVDEDVAADDEIECSLAERRD